MNKWITLLMVGTLMPFGSMAANAPSQQKVIREVVIKAEPGKVWTLIKNFGAIHQWHPAVASTTTETKADETGVDLLHRTLTLKDGGYLLEKQTINSDAEMKLEYKIVEGGLPVSGYRAVMTVKPGANAGETVVNWTGRFYNKANKVDALPGEDNATAVKAIEGIYDSGLESLKKVLESQ